MHIKFEGSGEVYPAHQFICLNHSSSFESLNEKTFTFAKEHDEEAAKNLVKFFYTGTLEYTSESQLVTFMILANKFKVKNIGEFKVPPKAYLNGVLEYVEKDLTNRLAEFDSLVESVNFKKLEKEDLTKLYAKKKWLQKSSSFLNIIIMKDMDDSASGSDKSDKDSETEEEEEEEEDGGSGGVPMMDVKLSHSSWSFNKKTKFMTCTSTAWNAFITKKPCDKFTVELGTGCGSHMTGFITKDKYNKDSTSNYNNGYYWYTNSNSLYGVGNKLSWGIQGGSSAGMKFGVVFDRKKGIISFYKDNSKVGDAFNNVDKKFKLFGSVDVCTANSNFKFIKGKYPKNKILISF